MLVVFSFAFFIISYFPGISRESFASEEACGQAQEDAAKADALHIRVGQDGPLRQGLLAPRDPQRPQHLAFVYRGADLLGQRQLIAGLGPALQAGHRRQGALHDLQNLIHTDPIRRKAQPIAASFAAQPDGSVTICSVGFLTNLRRLLETKPDDISPLDGRALVARKVKLWVAMACRYPDGKEYNSMWDCESSRIALENWPTPIVFSDWQYGCDCFAGRAVAEMDAERSPVKDVFAGNIPSRDEIRGDPHGWLIRGFGMGGRSAWDETAVLAAVRGIEPYFNAERGMYRMVGDKGDDEWAPDAENGPHVRITEKLPKAEVGRIIDGLITRRPKGGK